MLAPWGRPLWYVLLPFLFKLISGRNQVKDGFVYGDIMTYTDEVNKISNSTKDIKSLKLVINSLITEFRVPDIIHSDKGSSIVHIAKVQKEKTNGT